MGLLMVSGSESLANYLHNAKLPVPVAENGLILRQDLTGDFRFGVRNSDYNGCAWIAMYNAAKLLGLSLGPADIIRYLETRLPLGGAAFGGRLGSYPWGIGSFFRQKGYDACYSFLLRDMQERLKDADACILMYLRRSGRGHFVALRKLETDLCEFYNVHSGLHRNTLSGFLGEIRPVAKVLIALKNYTKV